MKLTKWEDLSSEQKKEIRRAFCMVKNNWEEWGKAHAFYIRKDGKLSQKHNHCEPAYLAD